MVLFIIKDPLQKEGKSMLKYIRPGDKVLLIQDGVLALNSSKSGIVERIRKAGADIIALEQDLNLRGIKNKSNARLVDYSGFLGLIEKNRVFS